MHPKKSLYFKISNMATSVEVIVTADSSGQLFNCCVWDPHSGTSLVTYKGDSSSPRTLQIISGQYMISAVNNKSLLHAWALQRKDQIQMRIVCPGPVTSLAVSPDGIWCVAAVAEKIHVWQVSTGNLMAVLSRHYQNVRCLAFTDDGSHFISAGDDNLVLVWPLARVLDLNNSMPAEPRFSWSNHSLPVTDICVGHGGIRARVATVSLDQTCKLWDLSSGQLLCTFMYDSSVTSVAMDTAEYMLFTGLSKGKILLVNLFEKPVKTERHVSDEGDAANIHPAFIGHSKQVTCLSVSTDGCQLLSGSHDTTVKLWDIPSRQCLRTLQHKGVITNAFFCPRYKNMFSHDATVTHPTQQFKRHLHTQGHTEIEGRPTVNIRLKGTGLQQAQEDAALQYYKDLFDNSGSEESDGTDHVEDLKHKIHQLQQNNKQLYELAVKHVIAKNK